MLPNWSIRLHNWRHDIQHNDIQNKGLNCDTRHEGLISETQYKGLICDTQYKRHSA